MPSTPRQRFGPDPLAVEVLEGLQASPAAVEIMLEQRRPLADVSETGARDQARVHATMDP
jgi:hypothetical protein